MVLLFSLATASAQTSAGPIVIRTETRMVLVDAVVTDKSGNAIRDLTVKDFHVWEDNKEQAIQSATFVAAPASNPERSYLVLFFDNASLDLASQNRAREAAVQFIETNAGPNRFVAIVDYNGAIAVSQNFTTDTDRLKRVAAAVKVGADAAGGDSNSAGAGSAARGRAVATAGLGADGFAVGLRMLAQNLATVPGRKNVVVFSAGFPISGRLNEQLTSAVQACNRSDLALYPVDVGGLTQQGGELTLASLGGAGGRRGSGAGGGRGQQGAAADAAASTQQVLYLLAAATGGYVYANANSVIAGLVKIGKEQTEYYLLGYTPAESPDGSCHPLKVKVDRGGATVRARASYCNVKAVDLLAGKAVEKSLEYQATGDQPGSIRASMQVPFFYTEADTSRLDVAIEIPSASIQFEKVKGKSHAELNILGIAYKPDGSVGARFSDTVRLDFATQKDLDAFHARPLHYEKQFFVAPGKYQLKVAFSSGGEAFGRLETPLTIEPYDGKQFMLSGLALSKEVHPASELGSAQDAELLEGRTPLVYKEMKLIPSGDNRFSETDSLAVYGEVSEPLLAGAAPPVVEVRMQIVDKKTNAVKSNGAMRPEIVANSATTTLPFAIKLKIDALTPGAYRVDVEAVDSAGKTMLRSLDFEIR